jgi:hypothetical protein
MIFENLSVSGSLRVTTGQVAPPRNTKANRPSSPESGSLFLQTSTSSSVLFVYTGVSNNDSGWEAVASQINPNLSFKYRQVIAYAYVAGGYKNSSPWKNVHKTVAATDQTTHIGELLDYPANYTKGNCSRTILFVFSANTDNLHKNPGDVQSTYTTAVNMSTDTNYAHQSKWDITAARGDHGNYFKETEFAYIFGGGTSTIDKFNLTLELCTTGFSVTSTAGSAASFSDENYGYGWDDSSGYKFNFATETSSAGSSVWGAHSQQKGISSKVGKGYAGNEGSYSGGNNLRRWNLSNDTNVGNIAKFQLDCGEENFTLGQDWQYMLGNYDGAQNNENWKMYYATDTGTANVSGLSPTAQAGQSSGQCGWRA